MKAIVLLGVPGAGKGTVAAFVERHTAYRHISTGDMFREVMREGSPLGRKVASYIDVGQLVPDDMVLNVVHRRLQRESGKMDCMFDGFPRTECQAELLDELLSREYGTAIEQVFYLELDEDLVVRRLTGRLTCEACGAVYHREHKKTLVEGVCDQCGAAVSQRDDDTRETIQARLKVFDKQTHGLIAYYEARKKLCRVDASGTPEAVAQAVLEELKRTNG
ncbi:MAG: adenylate kinase [Kiritimatiellae bacterium]|nr:adenylate kinase [Kiritimatiellia bacterium]MDD4737139.1 adenylate kinase [Kiritimatiellia bacterium]